MTREVPGRPDAEALKARYIAGAAAWRALPGASGMASLRLGAIGSAPQEAGTVLLVEGWSDLAAVEALLAHARGGMPDGVGVVSMGGVTNVGHLVAVIEVGGAAPDVVVLCDEAEEAVVTDGAPSARRLVCRRDLEEELIRAAGVALVTEVLAEMGEDRGLATFRAQPSQRDVPLADGLRRFLGTRSGRKVLAARELTTRLCREDRLPEVLAAVDEAVSR